MKRNSHAGKALNGGFGATLFSNDELEEIHLATLEVLENTGVFVEDPEAVELFKNGGAKVDPKNKIVKLQPYMVEEAIASAPSKLFLAGRNPENDIILESNRVGFTTFGEGVKVRDPYTGELRVPTKKDVANAAKLADAMEEIDVYERAIGAHEVPQAVGQLHNAEASFNNTSKHIFLGPFDGFQLDKIVEMAVAIAGSKEKLLERPLVTFITCPVSPLKLVKDTCEVIMGAARSGMAVNILSMAMAGGSSPVTLAGTLVNHNAEVLSGIVLSQLTHKGAKVIYGSSTTAMDLRLATASVGSPECAMISGAVARLARYYALPSFVAGGQADSKISDVQTGHEKTLTALLPALAGANLIYGLGMVESGMTFDFGQLVIDNEFAKMIRYVLGGIPVNDETLAVDVTKDVGPFKDFLSHPATYKHMRIQSQPKIINRKGIDRWMADGSKTMYEKAIIEAQNILENHQPDPLPPGVKEQLRKIVRGAEKEKEF